MNKKLKLISCALAVTLSIVVVENTVKYGPLGVDVVSAATTETTTTPTKTTTTTVTASITTNITRLLALGSVGGDVKLLQTWLNSNGSSLKVDGIFGKLTLAAVKNYQSKNGLVVDGIVGPKTIAKLTPVVVTPPVVTPPVVTPPVDTVSSASIVDNAAAFQKAISPVDKGGKWIIAITKDVTSDKALVLDGEFTNGKQDATTKLNVIQRKIALYAQDDKHVVTARFNLVAPKLTILSPNASVEHGNFKGDLYVSAPNFKLINAKIDGNVYFTNKAAKDTFTIADKDGDQKTVITGKQEVKLTEDVDVVATASVVNNKDAFEKAISKDGKWIIAVLDNLTFDKSLTLEGEFKNGKKDAVTGADLYQRKIALYAHAADKTTDARFTLTAPKLTINSPMASIEHGIFKGDVYVTVPNFKLVDAIVDGNVYFTTQAAKDTFKIDAASIITGQTAVKAPTPPVDVVTGASQVNDEATFEKNITDPNSSFMLIVNRDLTFTKDLAVVSGTKAASTNATTGVTTPAAPNRSIAPCVENLTTKEITKQYTITVPNLILSGKNEKVEYGIIKGNVYVQDTGFTLPNATINGSLYFANQALLDAYNQLTAANKGTVTGTIAVKAYAPAVDVVTGASQVNDEATFEKNIKDPNSYYMLLVNKDLTFTKDLTVVSATKPASTNATTGVTTPAAPNRSIAPCVEDLTTKQITKQYTITVPNLILSGKTEKVEDGIVKGNVYVQDTGFTLPNATINGNLYFANQALLDTYNQLTATNKGTVTGTIAVKAYK